jgi:hypothetical protein
MENAKRKHREIINVVMVSEAILPNFSMKKIHM